MQKGFLANRMLHWKTIVTTVISLFLDHLYFSPRSVMIECILWNSHSGIHMPFYVLCQSPLSSSQLLQDRNPQTTFTPCGFFYLSITKLSVPSVYQTNLMKSMRASLLPLAAAMGLSRFCNTESPRKMRNISDSYTERTRESNVKKR